MTTKVHAHVYDPTGISLFKPPANARAKSFAITCDMAGACDAFKSGHCIRLRLSFGGSDFCKYGQMSVQTGVTKKARSFYYWISKERDRLKDYPKAKRAPDRIFKIGDYWNLPYAFMAKSWAGSNYPLESEWVHSDNMSVETLSRIVNGKPRAALGGVLGEYQSKSVPKFLEDVRRNYPELWDLIPEDAKQRVKATSHIGRKAVLATCAPSAFDGWDWDGATLSGGTVNSLSLPADAAHIAITPKPGATIKITDNSQVTDETVFVD